MRKSLVYIILIILVFAGCTKQSQPDNGKINVITTIFPLYDFAKEVGKEKISVSMLLPPGVESHAYEPTPLDILKINECGLFVYIGESMEPWAHDLIASLKNKKMIVLEAEKEIQLQHGEESEEHVEHEEDAHGHTGNDPHIWLDFEIDQRIVLLIADALAKLDSANTDFYLNNAKGYNEKLSVLDNEYREAIAKCELRTIMYGGHFAFGYLAKRYGLTYISPYKGFTPDTEPAPQKIAELIDTIRQNKIEYLFYEELLEPRVAKAISRSTGVTLELLHAAHNVSKNELAGNIAFLTIMQENLEKLKKGLKYK